MTDTRAPDFTDDNRVQAATVARPRGRRVALSIAVLLALAVPAALVGAVVYRQRAAPLAESWETPHAYHSYGLARSPLGDYDYPMDGIDTALLEFAVRNQGRFDVVLTGIPTLGNDFLRMSYLGAWDPQARVLNFGDPVTTGAFTLGPGHDAVLRFKVEAASCATETTRTPIVITTVDVRYRYLSKSRTATVPLLRAVGHGCPDAPAG